MMTSSTNLYNINVSGQHGNWQARKMLTNLQLSESCLHLTVQWFILSALMELVTKFTYLMHCNHKLSISHGLLFPCIVVYQSNAVGVQTCTTFE